MARLLFSGERGIAANPKLALAYLQADMMRRCPEALSLLAERASLDLIVRTNSQGFLQAAAALGLPLAASKVALLAILESPFGPSKQLRASVRSVIRIPDTLNCIAVAQVLKHLSCCQPPFVEAPGPLSVFLAERSLVDGRFDVCSLLLETARELKAPVSMIAPVVSKLVKLAATGQAELSLPASLVESSLNHAAQSGDEFARYSLGLSLANLRVGRLDAAQLVGSRSSDEAPALLLSAAEGGFNGAWLALASVMDRPKTSGGNKGLARAFLEKAACAGISSAQRSLGESQLAKAKSIQEAEDAVAWIWRAALFGDRRAKALLGVLWLRVPVIEPSMEIDILERIRNLDADLGARLALARTLGLTRTEALGFDPSADFREWGLVCRPNAKANPVGRLAPAVTQEMREGLQRAREFFSAKPPVLLALRTVRLKQRRIFEQLGLQSEEFFCSDIGRVRSFHGWGKHWAKYVASSLGGGELTRDDLQIGLDWAAS